MNDLKSMYPSPFLSNFLSVFVPFVSGVSIDSFHCTAVQ
jgi:hypothetical protein